MTDDKVKPDQANATQTQQAERKPNDAPDFSQKAWDSSYKPEPWNATPQGRLAIRCFTRGIMGAMFFTAGGLWTKKLMQVPDAKEFAYNSEKGFGQILEQKNPLQFIAKTIDTFVGKPIESTVNLFHGNGQRFVHFKPTKYFKEYESGTVLGRSLGEETVFCTFDFFCASIGDALGRDLVGWFDPGQKKEWLDGKGNIKWPEAVKTLANSTFRYVTYNGGEDWAVAIPYVFFIKAQRNCIDKHLSAGYGFESDISMNASSLKMNTSSTPHHVAGSYSMEAMMDYQSRFTVYNIGTLLYREVYDKLEQAYHGKNVNLYGAPDAPVDKNRAMSDRAMDVVKWAIRGAVKGFLCMTPSVPFFSITRATQRRDQALFIDPHANAALGFTGSDGKPHYVTVSNMRAGNDGVTANTPVYYSRYNPDGNGGRGSIDRITQPISAHTGNPMARDPNFSEYHRRHNVIENAFSAIGEWNQGFARSFDTRASYFDKPGFSPLKKVLGLNPADNMKSFTRGMVNASVSYTPYMYAKAEFANLWDNGKTDLAVERMIDGAFSGNYKEFKAGIGDTWNAILHKPFSDPKREKEAQRRSNIDTSAAADADPAFWEQQGHGKDTKPAPDMPPWTERIVKGSENAAQKDAVSTKHSPQSHADRASMRKLLEEIEPPTNSIH